MLVSVCFCFGLFAQVAASSKAVPVRRITVSGLSSGADFAVQLQVAFASQISGAAIFAGQPFACAVQRFPADELQPLDPQVPICEGCPTGKTLVYDHCKLAAASTLVNVSLLVKQAQAYAKRGLIDSLSHLTKTRVYLFHGTKDQHYAKGSVAKTRDFFSELVRGENLKFKDDVPAGHAYSLPGRIPVPCGAPLMFTNNCQYDSIVDALQHLYAGSLNDKATRQTGRLLWFDQSPFFGDRRLTGLADEGRIYVPKYCLEMGGQVCDLHVNLHGCGFLIWPTFELLTTVLDFNNVGDSNNIVILYPHLQAHGSTQQGKQGCWDAYGQTGEKYATREGPQMVAVMNMATNISNIINSARKRTFGKDALV